ncbi:MAG: hypothetical protein IPI67_11435 [Myxococcales bacterium]|nr:hypothetical protein [Myxococcales bacterium]
MRLFLALVLSTLAAGCSVDALEDSSLKPPTNHCTADTDCGDGACDTTLGLCHAKEGQFATVLFEVTPPADADRYGGLSFLVAEDVAGSGGPLDLALGVVSKVTGTVQPQKADYQGSCSVAYGATNKSSTPPVKVTFTSTTTILGLPSQHFTAKTSFNTKTEQFEFEAWLPPDEYDVYVEPPTDSEDINAQSCTVVPQLVHGIKVEAGDVELPIPLQAPKLLEIEVLLPSIAVTTQEKTPLVGWKIDVIDPGTGRVLSAPALLTLVADPTDADNQHYVAEVEYAEAVGVGAGVGKELVRLRPPTGEDKPTLVLERAALELFTPGKAKIEAQKQLWPEAVVLDQISLFGTNGSPFEQVAAARFVSTKLDFSSGGNVSQNGLAFFEKTVEVQNGVATDVQLLPGEYDVYVAPPANSGFATTKAKLTVASGQPKQGGKSLTLELVSDVGGSVLVPSGDEAAAGATVQAIASPVLATPLEIAVSALPFAPKASSGIVGANGQYSLEADPGIFDFSIRPAEGTGFAWLVRPNVEVQSGVHDLGPTQLPLPVIYTGLITVPGAETPTPVPGTLIRAFIYLNSAGYTGDRAGAKSVVQIAEARADATGKFRLLLPSHLN